MRERPMLFRDDEVRAILAGRKTQLRRPVKLGVELPDGLRVLPCFEPGYFYGAGADSEPLLWPSIRCPYGRVGDRLWGREAWSHVHPIAIRDGRFSRPSPAGIPGPPPVGYRIVFRADGEVPPCWPCAEYPYRALQPQDDLSRTEPCRWRPSTNMPRWASRILLEITEVRVERVQDIGEADAMAEGVEPCIVLNDDGSRLADGYRGGFWSAWHESHSPKSWSRNDWVWAVSFRRVEEVTR